MTDFPALKPATRPPVVRIQRDHIGAYVTLDMDRVTEEDGEGRIYLSPVELAWLAKDVADEFGRRVFSDAGGMFKAG